jgi:hypothetical protein
MEVKINYDVTAETLILSWLTPWLRLIKPGGCLVGVIRAHRECQAFLLRQIAEH